MTYHQATLALAGLTLSIKPETAALLATCEQRLGRRLPAAVREWYALDPPSALMGMGTNQDWPYQIADLGMLEEDDGPRAMYNPVSQGYLVIMRENQSVVLWAVSLDGSDDPPVVVKDERPGGGWHRHADHFSSFLYTRVWDYQTMWREEGCRVEGGDAVVDETVLAWLRHRYHEEARTSYWPAQVAYRFTHPETGARVAIQNDALYSARRSSYNYFWGKDAARLEAVLRDVGQFPGMLDGLWSNDEDGGGDMALNRLQSS